MTMPMLATLLLTALSASAPAFPLALPTAKPTALPAPKTLALAQVVTFTPGPIKNLVPMTLIEGDREFGGNGPDIDCKVVLRVAPDGRSLLADIYFFARETKGDHSTVKESFTRTVFTAPTGKTIDRLESPTTSVVQFRSKKAGFQLLVPGEDVAQFFRSVDELAMKIADAHAAMAGVNPSDARYQRARQLLLDVQAGARDMVFRGNHVHNRTPASGPVRLMSIVGDTGGDDISRDRDGKDDTRIESITFGPVSVRYK